MRHARPILRDLKAVGTWSTQRAWTDQICSLLQEMIAATNAAREAGKTRLPRTTVERFLARYDETVEKGRIANPTPPRWRRAASYERDASNLVAAFGSLKPEIIRIVHDLRVAPTNNEAERSLRMAKLHKKISGCFQSERHMQGFAAVRSYIRNGTQAR